MIRLVLIGGALVGWVVAVLVLVNLLNSPVRPLERKPTTYSVASFVVGGVPVPDSSLPGRDRDPFRFAPTYLEQAVFSSEPDEGQSSRGLLDLDIELEGVLVRGGKPTAFVKHQGERVALKTNDMIGAGIVVAEIQPDKILLTRGPDMARWIYLTQ